MPNVTKNPVRSYRLQTGMKLHHLAEKWGTSPATLSRIENGTQRIRERLLAVISQEIGVRSRSFGPIWSRAAKS